MREESDSLGKVHVPQNRLWGAQTQRSLEHFKIGDDLIPREMIRAYALVKKGAALVHEKKGRLSKEKRDLICAVCDELLEGKLDDEFPLHVWMTGSGTQFNMNVNEVIANRCSQMAGEALGSKKPVHPNDDVNMSQSSNDTFPSAMYIAAASEVTHRLLPALKALMSELEKKVDAWSEIVKIGRTHLQDATPLTLGQEFSGYLGMLRENQGNIEHALKGVFQLALGGTAVGTGIHAQKGFDVDVAKEIAELTRLPFVTAPNKFAVQGAHNALVQLSGSLKTLATSLYKIANDIRLLACGPRAGLGELNLPVNEPGSSIMPGKVNPTQCEALCMIAIQVMAADTAVSMGNAGGFLEMNVFKPLMIYNTLHSVRLLSDGMVSFRKYCIEGIEPNLEVIEKHLESSLMLVTALSPVIGYDKASQIAHEAFENDLTLKEAALKLGFVTLEEFERIIDPKKMVRPHE